MADNFGLKIGVEGEKEFKKALSDINQSFKVLGSEMKLVSSQFDKNDKSIQALTARNDVLNKNIDAQRQKIEVLRADGQAAKVVPRIGREPPEYIRPARANPRETPQRRQTSLAMPRGSGSSPVHSPRWQHIRQFRHRHIGLLFLRPADSRHRWSDLCPNNDYSPARIRRDNTQANSTSTHGGACALIRASASFLASRARAFQSRVPLRVTRLLHGTGAGKTGVVRRRTRLRP